LYHAPESVDIQKQSYEHLIDTSNVNVEQNILDLYDDFSTKDFFFFPKSRFPLSSMIDRLHKDASDIRIAVESDIDKQSKKT